MVKRVLITGAGGFVGANLARRLIGEGYEVHTILRKETSLWRIRDILNNIIRHDSDLGEARALKMIIDEAEPDHILHLAAYGSYPRTQKDQARMIGTNFLGTVNLVNAAADRSYDSFINAGSSSEYGIKDHPMTEDDVLEPVNMYGVTKAAATLFCRTSAVTEGKPIATLRLFSAYGPWEEPMRLVPTVIAGCLAGRDVELTSGGQTRDFIHVDDVVEAFIKAMKAKRIGGSVLNIGSGSQHSVKEVAKRIHGLIRPDSRLLFGRRPTPGFETECWVADNTKAKKALGWSPNLGLDEGLEGTIAWFKSHMEEYRGAELA
ncbi:MAG: NAD-dependent epimerase/dehydratase family protein [Candidatus Altiarchaeota archaeon]